MAYYSAQKTVVYSLLLLQLCAGTFFIQSAEEEKEKQDASVIAWADKVPAVTINDIENYKRQIISENPEVEEMLKMIPAEEINRNIAEMLLQQYLVDSYIDASSISKTPGYQEDIRIAQQMAVTAVNNKYFSEEISARISLSDKELKKYYEAEKSRIPGVQKERGGIKTVGVSLKTEKEAQSFLKKVGSADLSQAAAKDKLTVKDFGMLSAERSINVDENVLGFALSATKFPQTSALQDSSGNWWVLQAVSKTTDSYYPFEEVKDRVAERALQAQIAEKVTDKLGELKKQYKITLNEEFFAGEEPLEITEEEVENFIEELGEMGEMGGGI